MNPALGARWQVAIYATVMQVARVDDLRRNCKVACSVVPMVRDR